MKIVTTGGTGRVGELLRSRWLASRGFGLPVYDLSLPEIDLLRLGGESRIAGFFDLEIDTWVDSPATFVIHLAGNSDPNCSMAAAADNFRMTANVVREASTVGAKVIFASSVWAEHEAHGLRPTFYGLSKLVSEKIVEDAGGISIRLGAVRPPANAPNWIKQLAMDDENVVSLFKKAMGAA